MADIGDFLKAILELGVPTNLKYKGSWGLEAGVDKYGATVQGLTLERDDGKTRSYGFVGAGMGVSISPTKFKNKGGSIDTDAFPSTGGRVIRGTWNLGAVTFTDLEGPAHIITIGAALGSGVSISIVIFGETVDFFLFSGVMFCAGIELASPGAGIMCYKGAFKLT